SVNGVSHCVAHIFHSVAYSVAQITNAVSQFTGYSSVVFRVFFILLLHRVVPVLIRLVFRCVISVPGSLIFCCIISVFSHIILRRVVFHLFFFLFFRVSSFSSLSSAVFSVAVPDSSALLLVSSPQAVSMLRDRTSSILIRIPLNFFILF